MALAGMPELLQLYNEGQLRLLRALPVGLPTAPLSSHDALGLTQKQQSVKLQVIDRFFTFALISVPEPALFCGGPRLAGMIRSCLPTVFGSFAGSQFAR